MTSETCAEKGAPKVSELLAISAWVLASILPLTSTYAHSRLGMASELKS